MGRGLIVKLKSCYQTSGKNRTRQTIMADLQQPADISLCVVVVEHGFMWMPCCLICLSLCLSAYYNFEKKYSKRFYRDRAS